MSGTTDIVSGLERHRLQLEENIEKLQKALQHWQTWDAEYEALKEEVDAVPENKLATIQDTFDGELINRREIDDIFGGKGSRSKEQIKNVLDRRIDYVTKNVESLTKQIETLENKLAAVTVISQPDSVDEEGQPITEIIEELDDDDNVVSYRLSRPADSVPLVKEALEQAGVKDLPEGKPEEKQETVQPPIVETTSTPQPKEEPAQASQVVPVSSHLAEEEASKISDTTNKVVSFATETKSEDGPKPQVSRNAKRVEQIMQNAKDQEKISQDEAVLPEDEDEDDAELRRQMLAYGMDEIGAVVAELELDEGGSDEDDDYEFDYSDEGFEEDEDEDNYGRYTGRVITDDYAERMLELEKKLGIKSRFTSHQVEPENGDDGDSSSDDEGIGRIVIKRDTETPASKSSASRAAPVKSNIKEKQTGDIGKKKGVRFASSLDIAPEDEPMAPTDMPSQKKKQPLVEPLSDIVERSGPAKTAEPKSSRKPSRFKQAKGNTGVPLGPLDVPAKFLDQDRPAAPTGPEGATIADTLVERETSSAPKELDDFDADIIQDAVADEYHRLRNKFIQREGGFLKEDESPIQPLDEPEGGRERVSRFKAARLSRQ